MAIRKPSKKLSGMGLMPILQENLTEADCIPIQRMVQARAEKKKNSETGKYAAGVVEETKRKMMEQHEDEEGQQRMVEGWLEQTGTVTRIKSEMERRKEE